MNINVSLIGLRSMQTRLHHSIGSKNRRCNRYTPGKQHSATEGSSGMKTIVLSIIACILVLPVTAKTRNELLFSVRLPNGADQHYQLVVPADIAPAKGGTWATPYLAHSKVSPRMASVLAVAWAGGLSKKEKGGPPNSLVNVGGNTPGGFYYASYVRPDSVELRNEPLPYYLVRMTGQVGNSRQTLYAAVLEDGRIIQPTPISAPPQTAHAKKGHH